MDSLRDDSPRDDSRNGRARGVAFALLSAVGFSTLGIFAELLYGRGFSVQQTLAWRFTFSAAFLALLLFFRAKAARLRGTARHSAFIPRKRLLSIVLLGLLGFSPQAGLYFFTVKLLDPGITSMLLYLYPSFVLIISLIFLKRKPVRTQVAALVLSLSGCLLTFFRSGAYPAGGLALGVLVAVAYAAYLVSSERILAGIDSVAATAVIMASAAVVYWIWVLVKGDPVKAPSDPGTWLAVAGVALVATVLPITTLFSAIKLIGASDTSLASTIEPVCTVALSLLILGEKITIAQGIGGALILAGVATLHFATVPAARPAAVPASVPVPGQGRNSPNGLSSPSSKSPGSSDGRA